MTSTGVTPRIVANNTATRNPFQSLTDTSNSNLTEDEVRSSHHGGSGSPPINERIAVLETRVTNIEKILDEIRLVSLPEIRQTIDSHFRYGCAAFGLVLSAFVGTWYWTDQKFDAVDTRLTKLEVTVGRMDEKMKNIDKTITDAVNKAVNDAFDKRLDKAINNALDKRLPLKK